MLRSEDLKKLNQTSLVSSISMIAFDWCTIIALSILCWNYFSWPLYFVCILIIGNRQHGLLVLMHDASHFRFSPKRWLNDGLAELFLAWPLFIRMVAYRHKHLQHHKYSNTAMDPDYRPERFLRSQKEILIKTVMDFFALNTHEQFFEIVRLKVQTSQAYKLSRFGFYVFSFGLITFLGGWKPFLLFWIVPAFTWLKVILRIRAIADHTGLQFKEAPFDTRTIIPTVLDRLIFAPHNCCYHLVHHAYGAIPCQNLKKAHALLLRLPEFKEKAHITEGFSGFFQEFPWDKSELGTEQFKVAGINLVDKMPV